ncbi:FmdB family zinc ribbon protein [Streptomyces sp. 796.1]|uniref:FmdB family zinc ribbon protein n=1 Tax=Streptomyces sp. 796.1 TaxID=3163029 RepID=UPI0039C8E41C
MPTYQYQCTECGEGLEAVQKFSDEALTECPSCKGRLRKVFSAVGVVFKGSGFYRTDSRNASSSSSPSSSSKTTKSSSETSSSSGSTSSSSDSSSSSSSSTSTSSSSSTTSSGSTAA